MKFKKIFIALIMIVASLSLASCNKEPGEDDMTIDYSSLSFSEVFEIEYVKISAEDEPRMNGLTMAQLTSPSLSGAYKATRNNHFNLKAKYDVTITGISYNYKGESEIVEKSCWVKDDNSATYYMKKTEELSIPTDSYTSSYTFDTPLELSKNNAISIILAGSAEDSSVNMIGQIYNFKLTFTVTKE